MFQSTTTRSLLLLTSFALVISFASIPPAWGGIAAPCEPPLQPNCVDPHMVCQSGPRAGLECLNQADCLNSQCVATTFLPDLSRVCKNGDKKGEACASDNDCPLNDACMENCSYSKCVIAFEENTPLIHAILTLIVDDDETDIEAPGESRGAATLLLEIENEGRRSLLAQTYVALDADYPEVEFLRREIGLNDAVMDASLLNRLLFRDSRISDNPDAFASAVQIAAELRKLFKATGRPLVVGTPERIRPIDHSNYETEGLASVVRLRVAIRFVRVE
jgi:hypothetical protein